MMPSVLLAVSVLLILSCPIWAETAETLPNTASLDWKDDLSARMVAGCQHRRKRGPISPV